jgi:hypothetical protein
MWLRVSEGQLVQAAIDISTIKSVAKHWTGSRLEPCLGEGCPCCLRGLSRRWRYQVKLIVAEEEQDWEFGEESLKDIQRIAHDGNWIQVSIAREGRGKNTRYRVLSGKADNNGGGGPAAGTKPGSSSKGLRVVNKYTTGRYGHLVRS